MNLSPTALNLLKYLDVHLLETWEVDAWGDPTEYLHVFAPRELVDQVSSFFMGAGKEISARVFEGPPPPF